MKTTFTKILVELDGEIVDIMDLSQEKYELFLEITNQIRTDYKRLTNKRT